MQSVVMFEQVYMGEQREKCIWNSFKFKLEFEFAIHLQYTPFKWNCLTHQKHENQVSTFNHLLVHFIYFATLLVVCRVEVEPKQEATPFVEDLGTEPRHQGKKPPPLIMSIKTHFPLFLLCMIRMVTL